MPSALRKPRQAAAWGDERLKDRPEVNRAVDHRPTVQRGALLSLSCERPAVAHHLPTNSR